MSCFNVNFPKEVRIFKGTDHPFASFIFVNYDDQ